MNEASVDPLSQPISFKAKLYLSICRGLVKPSMPKRLDLEGARKVAARLDRWVGGKRRDYEQIPVTSSSIKADWIRLSEAKPKFVVLYLHGGGFMLHLPAVHGRLAARLCSEIDGAALMPDYGLAPDFPLPAAHIDCFASYQWLLAEGYDPAHIVIAGDSAGGLLVLSTLQRIRDADLPRPLCGIMFSPGTCIDSIRSLRAEDTKRDPMIGPGILELLQRHVIAPAPANDPATSPCAGSLAGLAPLLFQVGSTEMLLAQSVKGYDMARAAGTQAELQIWPQMPHVWQAVHWLPEARKALGSVADFIFRQSRARTASEPVNEPSDLPVQRKVYIETGLTASPDVDTFTSPSPLEKPLMNGLPERLADRLYDDVWLPDETIAVRKKVRAFAQDVLAPIAHSLNNTPESVAAFPWQLVKQMGDAGLFRIPFSREDGGDGLAYPTLATMVMLEEIAYLSSGAAAALIDVQLILFGHTLKHAQDSVKRKIFPALCRGDIVGSFATSEPGASTDLSVTALRTEAKAVSGGYRLTGTKRWITNSPVAHYMFVLCKMDGAMTMLLVDMKSEGVRVGEPDKKMGNHCQLTADVNFNDVFVPQENLVGEVNRGLKAALTSLTLGRVGIGACGVGMGQAAFDYAVAYMQKRYLFGKTLSQFQYWQFKFADYATQLESARNLYVKAALAEDRRRPSVAGLCAMAKLSGSSLAGDIARDAIQVCGGYGFVKELAATGETYPLEAIYRDSKIGEIYEGANEIQRMLIARDIFGKSAVG